MGFPAYLGGFTQQQPWRALPLALQEDHPGWRGWGEGCRPLPWSPGCFLVAGGSWLPACSEPPFPEASAVQVPALGASRGRSSPRSHEWSLFAPQPGHWGWGHTPPSSSSDLSSAVRADRALWRESSRGPGTREGVGGVKLVSVQEESQGPGGDVGGGSQEDPPALLTCSIRDLGASLPSRARESALHHILFLLLESTSYFQKGWTALRLERKRALP